MIIATLCTTNIKEPWAANVPFEVSGAEWATTLKTKYTHFQNLKKNSSAVIVYKKDSLELIAKVQAKISEIEATDSAEVVFATEWLRVVVDEGTQDFKDQESIIDQINQRLLS